MNKLLLLYCILLGVLPASAQPTGGNTEGDLKTADPSKKNMYSNNEILTNDDWYHNKTHKKTVYDKTVKDLILINNYDGVLECYDLDFNKKWSFRPDDTLRLSNGRNQLYYKDGVVLTAYMTGYIYAIDVKTGELFWEGKIAMDKEKLHLSSQSLQPTDSLFYVTSRTNNNVYAINATTGEMEWNYNLSSPYGFMPALPINANVVVTTDPIMSVFNAKTGKLLASKNCYSNFSKMVSSGHNVIVSFDNEDKVIALNSTDLSTVWEYQLPKMQSHVSKKILTVQDKLYFSTNFGRDSSNFFGINSTNGELLWHLKVGNKVDYMTNIEQYIYGYSEDKIIFELDIANQKYNSFKVQYQPVSNILKQKDVLYYYAIDGLIKFDLNSNNESIVLPYLSPNGKQSRLDSQIYFIQ